MPGRIFLLRRPRKNAFWPFRTHSRHRESQRLSAVRAVATSTQPAASSSTRWSWWKFASSWARFAFGFWLLVLRHSLSTTRSSLLAFRLSFSLLPLSSVFSNCHPERSVRSGFSLRRICGAADAQSKAPYARKIHIAVEVLRLRRKRSGSAQADNFEGLRSLPCVE